MARTYRGMAVAHSQKTTNFQSRASWGELSFCFGRLPRRTLRTSVLLCYNPIRGYLLTCVRLLTASIDGGPLRDQYLKPDHGKGPFNAIEFFHGCVFATATCQRLDVRPRLP